MVNIGEKGEAKGQSKVKTLIVIVQFKTELEKWKS